MSFLKKIFRKKKSKPEFSDEELNRDYELKMAGLEAILGKSHNMVGHAIIPFSIGGAVDMYYFPNGISGTGFATMELLKPDGTGPVPNKLGTYELVAFTKLHISENEKQATPFQQIERKICGIFTGIGNYSFQAKLEPKETCELPQGKGEPNTCLIFDEYSPEGKAFYIDKRKHGLLLVMEVHRSEMEYAMQNGTVQLLKKLKAKGFYPYSDMDREPVA